MDLNEAKNLVTTYNEISRLNKYHLNFDMIHTLRSPSNFWRFTLYNKQAISTRQCCDANYFCLDYSHIFGFKNILLSTDNLHTAINLFSVPSPLIFCLFWYHTFVDDIYCELFFPNLFLDLFFNLS